MAMGSQQLAEDYTQLKDLLELYPNIAILKADGQPPDNYEIEYSLRGFVKDADNNIVIGQKGNFFTRGKELSRKVREISDRYGLDINPDKKVYEMSVGEKQTLEII